MNESMKFYLHLTGMILFSSCIMLMVFSWHDIAIREQETRGLEIRTQARTEEARISALERCK